MILAEKLDIFIVIYLDDIIIYIKDSGRPYVDVIWWVLKQLQKYGLHINLKKYQFHEDEIWFLDFVVLAYEFKIEEGKIEIVKTWPELQSIRDIQIFLDLTKFYRNFIKNFSKIIAPLTSILQITNNKTLSTKAIEKKKNKDISSNTTGTNSGRIGRSIKNLSTIANLAKSKKSDLTKSKKPKLTKSKKSDLPKANFTKLNSFEIDFLTPEAKKPSYTYKRLLPRLQFLGILI